MSAFGNRLVKNAKHFGKWARRQGLTAYRLYDHDQPEMPVVVDVYGEYLHLALYPRRNAEQLEATARAEASAALGIPSERIFTKVHQRLRSDEQYERQGGRGVTTVVNEGAAKFEVNLSDYLDVGLFLDHRNTRLKVGAEAKGKQLLNLFSYTGAFSVHAGLGGAASTTSVDLSTVYSAWTRRNLALNGLNPRQHAVVEADAMQWIDDAVDAHEEFELIVLDPPSFSRSTRASRFEVQADHRPLVEQTLSLLAPGGALYFSTNLRTFELDPALASLEGAKVEELTPRSLPEDCRSAWHRCWRFERI